MTNWAEELLGALIEPASGTSEGVMRELCQFGIRQNPKRAHLLVSPVLGRHIPANPDVVLAVGRTLGSLAGKAIRGEALHPAASAEGALAGIMPPPVDTGEAVLVVGFAETATGLGQAAAEGIVGSRYVHSTRSPAHPNLVDFQESHSHATDHTLAPWNPEILVADGPAVLVDDEFSTGATVEAVIRRLHQLHPRTVYVVASILDMRTPSDRTRLQDLAFQLGVTIRSVALAEGSVHLPTDVHERAAAVSSSKPSPRLGRPGHVTEVMASWPIGVPYSGSEGLTASQLGQARDAAGDVARGLARHIPGSTRRVHVIAWEEFAHVPALVASELKSLIGAEVLISSTTRSPAHVVQQPGYPLQSVVEFAAAGEIRRAYNTPAEGSDVCVALAPPAHDLRTFLDVLSRRAPITLGVNLRPAAPAELSRREHRIWLTTPSGNGTRHATCLRAIPNVTLHGSSSSPQSALETLCDTFHLEPENPSRSEFLEHVIQQIASRNIDLVVPRRGLRVLAENRDLVESTGARLLAPTADAIWMCTDKAAFIDVAQRVGAPVARSYRVTTPDELAYALEELAGAGLQPCVKPAAGHGGLGFYLVSDSEPQFRDWADFRDREPGPNALAFRQLSNLLIQHPEAARNDPLLVCEFLPGPELSVDCWSDGDGLRSYVMRLKRSTVFVTQAIAVDDPALLQHVEAVAGAIGLLDRNCVFNIQFRRAFDGGWRLQEANPRPSGGTHIAAGFGANLLASAAAHELGIRIPDPVQPAPGTTLALVPESTLVPPHPDPVSLLGGS